MSSLRSLQRSNQLLAIRDPEVMQKVIELPVNDSMLMQEMQCQNDFRAVESRPILVEFSGPLNLEHEISAVDIFHDEEKSVLKNYIFSLLPF